MQVSLVSLTQPVLREHPVTREMVQMTPEELIVFCARVSNPSNQLNTMTGPRLIRHCLLEQPPHISIFDMADMTVEIATSRAMGTQILRHWSFRFQEFSTRYAAVSASEPIELRKQGAANRQGGEEPLDRPDLDAKVAKHVEEAFALYAELLDAGTARECARLHLPMSSRTVIYMKGTVRSWLTYLNVRLDQHTQKEHRLIAERIADIFAEHFPVITEATGDLGNRRGCFMSSEPKPGS